MSEKMRATMHNGRAGKKGVYRAAHNDRNFDTGKAEHIDPTKSSGNWTWHMYKRDEPGLTFEQAEARFYDSTFRESLEAKNERYRKNRHEERVQTMDEFRASKQGCPEETVLQIGNMKDTVPPAVLRKIAVEQINWEIRTFPNVKILDAALHVDEEGAPHMHKRQVWVADGKDGPTVGQNKALKAMGIERPEPDKAEGRYNNAKMTYTERCRDHFLSLCREHGLDIEAEPKEASEVGLTLLEYQRRQEQERLAEIKEQQQEAVRLAKRQTDVQMAEAVKTGKREVDAYTEGKLAEIRSTFKSREKAVAARESAAAAREASIRDSSASLDRRSEELAAREESIAGMEQAMRMRDRRQKKRDAEQDARDASLTNREKRIAARDAEQDARDASLTNREKGIAARDAEQDARESSLAEELQTVIEKKKALNARTREFVSKMDKAYESLERMKLDICNMTDRELERRQQLNNDDDFGKSVAALDFGSKGLSR